jgi:8-oxo-dGTP pyrophosphatase MutT (NUDIX family)
VVLNVSSHAAWSKQSLQQKVTILGGSITIGSAMTGSAPQTGCRLSALEFFARATACLSFDLTEGPTGPPLISCQDYDDPDPTLLAAIAATPPSRMAAVLVPIIARAEPTVLFKQRTAQLGDHAGQVLFPGGKIDVGDVSPAAATLCEAEEEIALDRRFVEPIGYLDVHITLNGFRIVPTVPRAPRLLGSPQPWRGRGRLEVPLTFLIDSQNYRHESADRNGLITTVRAIPFNGRSIWRAPAGILRNLWERIYKD